ncbi:uncharacterized protein C6orf136 homolog isoform X2 [Rhinoraja longicauda]
MCGGGFFRHHSTIPWTTPDRVWHQNKRQMGVETCEPSLVDHGFRWAPSVSLHCACTLGPHTADVHPRALVDAPEQISVQVVVWGCGRGQVALVERPCVGVEQLVASRVERLPRELEAWLGADQASAILLSHLLGSITTVDGRSADDIAVEHRPAPGSREGPPVEAATPRDPSEGQPGSFRTPFGGQRCREPRRAGLQSPRGPVSQLAFSRAGHLKTTTPGKEGPKMEEHLAVLHEKLRLQLPSFFLKPHDYEIYSRNVEFVSAFPRIKTRGRSIYRALVTLTRFIAWNYCADLHMEVIKMTQHPEDWTVQVRWRVTGIPLHVLMLKFYKKDRTELYRTYDAYSIFYLGADGLVHRHQVIKMVPTQPHTAKVKRLLIGVLVALGLEEHRPALNLLFAQAADKAGQKHC